MLKEGFLGGWVTWSCHTPPILGQTLLEDHSPPNLVGLSPTSWFNIIPSLIAWNIPLGNASSHPHPLTPLPSPPHPSYPWVTLLASPSHSMHSTSKGDLKPKIQCWVKPMSLTFGQKKGISYHTSSFRLAWVYVGFQIYSIGKRESQVSFLDPKFGT